jgi:hypothetical protein
MAGADRRYSISVVSCAPSSATNTAINSAGSVLLALAETKEEVIIRRWLSKIALDLQEDI